MTIEDHLPDTVKNASTVQLLRQGDVLFSRNSPTTGVYEVLQGRVRLSRMDHTGHETILYVARVGDPLAEASIFSQTYHCDAIAASDATVRLYPKAPLLREYENNPAFAKAYAMILARQLMDTRAKVEMLNMNSARARIRHYLSRNACSAEHHVEIKGSLKELALELGLTHEALYRTLARMAESGEIERNGNIIKLV